MFWKALFVPMLLYILLMLGLNSLVFGLFFLFSNVHAPHWVAWLLPFLISLICLALFAERLFFTRAQGRFILQGFSLSRCVLFAGLPILVSFLFSPLAKSLRYNFAQVLVLDSIDELQANQTTAFLETPDWYADRMRVLPLHTYKRVTGKWGRSEYQLNSLFLLPIFSREKAYRTYAKAWLAFNYSGRISVEEFQKKQHQEFYERSTAHFKRRDVRAFRYLERYPRGAEYDLLMQLARAHHYFQSGYANVYQGEEVDRDVQSAYFLKYALFLLVIVGLPLILLLSAALYALPAITNYMR